MESIADAVVAAGVRQVTGGVRADESRYDQQRARPGWKASYAADGEVAPLSALLVDDGEDANQKPVPQPALQFAQVLTTMLQARGVQVGGGPSVGAASGGADVAAVPSLPVRDLVAEMVREADNTTAELLLKEVGHAAGGAGTTEAGLAAARAALQKRGLDVSALQARDGSGLDRGDRVTCDLLVKALQSQGRSSELASSLPVAAQTGTLAKRFVATAAAGRLHAKTGTLDGVSALVGWVDPARAGPPPLAFAVVANGVPLSLPVTKLGDAFGVALASWPDAPAAEAVAPLPAAPAAPTPP
jgi:D-alanyl-D-alanine carboxypeptidase/D-alanyl-D-alanine-endopeptidase (penicillin-binding protein 4)